MKDYNCEIIGQVVSVEENPDFVEFYVSSKRRNGKLDLIPVVIEEKKIYKDIQVNSIIQIKGLVKTVRKKGEASKLRVDVKDYSILESRAEDKNIVFGRFIVKSVKSLRKLSTGSIIKNIELSQPQDNGGSDFRAVLWNETAIAHDNLDRESELYIIGRLQSREYEKKKLGKTNRYRTYEVSVGKVEDDTDNYAEVVYAR